MNCLLITRMQHMGPPREADVKLAALVPQHNKSTNVNPSRPHIIIAGILLNRIFGVPTLAQMKGTADSCRGVVDEECGRAAADAYHFPERAQSSSIRLAGSSFKPPCCARAGRRASHQPLPVCHRRRINRPRLPPQASCCASVRRADHQPLP